jgi:7-cyano-7-deazaguanine synthase
MQAGTKVLLSSGGMDSFLLANEPELAGAVHVFVDIGQKYLIKEEHSAKNVAHNAGSILEVVKATQIAEYEHSSGIIPFRNAEMLLCAAQYGTELYFGVIADEINSDKSVEFCAAIEAVLNISHRPQYWTEGKQFTVHTPFRNMTKSHLAERYLIRGGSLQMLLNTVSCYSATDAHCGRCASCFKRWVALVNVTQTNSWADWGFLENPYAWKPRNSWVNIAHGYTQNRANEIMSALSIAKS